MKQSLRTNELDIAKKTRVQRMLHIVHETKKSGISDIHGCREGKGNMYDEERCWGKLKINS